MFSKRTKKCTRHMPNKMVTCLNLESNRDPLMVKLFEIKK